MSKGVKFLLVSTFLLMFVTACAGAAPTSAELPTETLGAETLPLQEVTTALPAADSTIAAPAPIVQPPAAAPADPSISTSEAQVLLDGRCKRCHSLERVTSFKGDLAAWEIIVNDMIARGADLSDEEKAILLQFLAENYK